MDALAKQEYNKRLLNFYAYYYRKSLSLKRIKMIHDVTDPDAVFEKLEILGTGTFGEVFKMRDIRDNQAYAVKIVNLDVSEEELKDIHSEVRILSEFDSKYMQWLMKKLAK